MTRALQGIKVACTSRVTARRTNQILAIRMVDGAWIFMALNWCGKVGALVGRVTRLRKRKFDHIGWLGDTTTWGCHVLDDRLIWFESRCEFMIMFHINILSVFWSHLLSCDLLFFVIFVFFVKQLILSHLGGECADLARVSLAQLI
jgi:hypothetical protein